MKAENQVLRRIALVVLFALPLSGVLIAGRPLAPYLQFPPMTHRVVHAGFSWPVFVVLALAVLAVVLPFVLRVLGSRRRLSVPGSPSGDVSQSEIRNPKSAISPSPLEGKGRGEGIPPSAFPRWGWLGLLFGVLAWILAWTRLPWFAPLQPFTFTPLWLAYIVVVNALTWKRTGRCMMLDRPRRFLLLFAVSAAFWWFFEFLNRFVQNWYYARVAGFSPLQYFLFATLPFSTVLPAVLGTHELLRTFPRLSAGLGNFVRFSPECPRTLAVTVLLLSCAGLTVLGIWPDYVFPLLWLSPLLVVASLQALRGRETVFAPIARGDWSRIALLALAALVCGVFWEMWNYWSLAKWRYSVPFVHRFLIFEMPILGYAGYLPFGLECAVIADLFLPSRPPDAIPAAERPVAGEAAPGRPARQVLSGLAALGLGAAVWLPCLHLLFRQDPRDFFSSDGVPPKASALAARHLELWSNPSLRAGEIRKMRRTNEEWDFMSRTFFVLSLANLSLREPARQAQCLEVMDAIVDETIRLERENGIYYFLMDYAQKRPFVCSRKRSLFQDGEIGLMLAVRRLVAEKPDYKPLLAERVETMVACMKESPVLSGESYPDECWMFCNTVALAAIRIADALDDTDHSEFLRQWVATARRKLTDPVTGLLVSSYSFSGRTFDGPEGSSIWMSAHCLQVVDRAFARDQYARARRELGRAFLGFGYAKEWPHTWRNAPDVDSGPVIPVLDVSAGSSGLAFVGAASFGDRAFLERLLVSLHFGGFPVEKGNHLRYCAGNQIGDAVLLYAMVLGPVWQEAEKRSPQRGGTRP